MINQQTFKSTKPKLYLIGTPIGNLNDFSFRAIEVLNSVNVIFCEDTRTSQVLLQKYAIQNRLLSLHKFNENERLKLIAQLINEQQSIALISDAGVPLVSDPGGKVVAYLRQNFAQQVDITAINAGPAYLHALISSGFTSSCHTFVGFLKNRQPKSKTQELQGLIDQFNHQSVLILYESVHRILATIQLLTTLLPITQNVCLARELTKINEQVLVGSIQEVNEFVQSPEFKLKGEFVLVIDQNQKVLKSALAPNEVIELIEKHLEQGLKLKEAAQVVSQEIDQKPNEIYQLYVKMKKNL